MAGETDFYITIDKSISYHFAGDTVFLNHSLTLPICATFSQQLIEKLKEVESKNIIFNLNSLTDIDSAGVTSLFYVKRILERHGKQVEVAGGDISIGKKLKLFHPQQYPAEDATKRVSLPERIGEKVYLFYKTYFYSFLSIAADISFWAVADLFRSKTRRKGEFTNQAILIGVNAVLIVVFMSFVIGLVLALQSAQQLRSFGANIYIVDLTVIGMMSQMGPLITGILVAGRSGSAIAAEIATMKVTSELDALTTMGLDPVRFIVVPKLYASLFTMPFLVLLSIITGIVGGAVTANIYLGITPEIFVNRMANVAENIDLITAFIKSQAYAGVIVLTGSFYGFRVVRGAEGVGKVTTSAVVVAISLVIIVDSIIGLIFY